MAFFKSLKRFFGLEEIPLTDDTPPVSSNEAEPFAVPKHSHASHSGSSEYRAKYPNPAIARCGAFSLKKNGENSGARNSCVVVGFQKLTSSHEGCWLK